MRAVSDQCQGEPAAIEPGTFPGDIPLDKENVGTATVAKTKAGGSIWCADCRRPLENHSRVDTREGPEYFCPNETGESLRLAALRREQEFAETLPNISTPIGAVDDRQDDPPPADEFAPDEVGEFSPDIDELDEPDRDRLIVAALWLTDPKYGGMSPTAAENSWRAGQKRIQEEADGEPILEPSGENTTVADASAETAAKKLTAPPKVEIATLPPLTLNDWRSRDLPEPDFIMGHWLTTTSRVLLTAATGIGKTNFGLALGMRIAAREDFLHWRAHRPCRVLYIDGEMSRRLLRQRVLDEEKRVGITPEFFFALSHEDIEGFKPLNTIEGQAWMDALINKVGGVDLVIVDNIMSLTVGDMKDPEPWQQTIPWALSLTKAAIGQVWIHHTGHDETRSYGDKTREWQMDTVAHLDAVKRDDTDISFSMVFKKSRERTPATRFDFQDVKIALVNDRWEHELTQTQRPDKISPQAARALDALRNIIASGLVTTLPGNRRAVSREAWMDELAQLGMIDRQKANSARTLFLRWRRELVAAFRIGCQEDWSWPL
jgi:hypothetical protein